MKKWLQILFYMFVTMTAFNRCALAENSNTQNQPKLIEQKVTPKNLDSEGFKKLILDNNKSWLNPEPVNLSYTFSMKHVNQDDLWKATVDIASHVVSIQTNKGVTFDQMMDNKYDPYNNAQFPRLLTVSQGISFFGPLHEFCWTPDDDDVKLVSQGSINGKQIWIGQISPVVRAESEPIPKWLEDILRMQATRPTYLYEFTPAKDKDGKLIIAIKCVNAQGPGWAEISALYKQNPSKIVWGGKIISAQIRNFSGEERPVIVINKDENFTGASPITRQMFNIGVNNMTDKLTLGEGPGVVDEALFEHLKEKELKSRLSIRVGCGIFRTWYGSYGSSVDIDQIWVEKETGLVLKEEGFSDGKCCFTVSYEDYEKTDNKYFPKHIVVTLYQMANLSGMEGIYPWIFDMRFNIHQGKVWLLKELTEIKAATKIDTKAEITNVVLKSGN